MFCQQAYFFKILFSITKSWRQNKYNTFKDLFLPLNRSKNYISDIEKVTLVLAKQLFSSFMI